MIDLHFHVLPGIDDGPDTLDESLALAQAAAAGGTRSIVATPHVSWRYPNDPETIVAQVDLLNAKLSAQDIAVNVVKGAEIAISQLSEISPDCLAQLTLGSGPWLLIEPPFATVAPALEGIIFDLMRSGHRVLIAHPERCQALHRDSQIVRRLVRAGALTSITAGSLNGRFGSPARRFAWWLMEEQLVHNVASDAHDTNGRPPSLGAELSRAGIADLAEWLTELVPAAILAGEMIPSAPFTFALPKSRGASLLRRLGHRPR